MTGCLTNFVVSNTGATFTITHESFTTTHSFKIKLPAKNLDKIWSNIPFLLIKKATVSTNYWNSVSFPYICARIFDFRMNLLIQFTKTR